MPLTYPPAAPTQSGDITSIHQFLQSPALLQRRLRTLAEHRFISDVLLPQRYPVEGGAIQYQQGESIFTDRVPQQVRPGMEYPRSGVGHAPVQIAEVVKWGQDVPITDESIKRLRLNPLNNAMAKLVNHIVKQVDSIALAAITSTVTATRAASALWTGTTATILRDILLAVGDVRALNQGFDPDTVVVDDTVFAYLASDTTITNALAREAGDTPVYTGMLPLVGGLRVLSSSPSPAPARWCSTPLSSAGWLTSSSAARDMPAGSVVWRPRPSATTATTPTTCGLAGSPYPSSSSPPPPSASPECASDQAK